MGRWSHSAASICRSHPGVRTAIVGPSGSGKTTLLRIIAGFEVPDRGRVVLDGRVLANGSEAVPTHQRRIGYVSQDGALFPHLSVAENIGFGLLHSVSHRAERIAELLDMVELSTNLLLRRPDELSGGQQQRVAVARALAQKPQLMLLDEPFSALDTGLRASTRKTVARVLSAVGITTVLVTHDQAEALSFADQVAVIRDGQLPQAGHPRELYLRPQDPMIAQFLGEAIILPAESNDGWAECALGRIKVNGSQRQGNVRIMLRPEQVQLTEVSGNELTDAGVGVQFAEVVDFDFGGAVCTIALRLLSDTVASDAINGTITDSSSLLLRSSYPGILAAGTFVRIALIGEAHVFGS